MHEFTRRPLAAAIAGLLSGYLFSPCLVAAPAIDAPVRTPNASSPDGTPIGSILVTPGPPGYTTEAGGTVAVGIVLSAPPSAPVLVTSYTNVNYEIRVVSGEELQFDGSNWNEPQFALLKGQDDLYDDGDFVAHVYFSPASADPAFDQRTAEITVVNVDDDNASMVITPAVGLSTGEHGNMAGLTSSFTVSLATKPKASVVNVAVRVLDSNEGEVLSGEDLKFYMDTWNIAQTVTLRGIDDDIDDGDVPYEVRLISSSWPPDSYNNQVVFLEATNIDDETLIVSPQSGLQTGEQGNTASFSVVLGSAPTAPVNVSVLSLSDEGIAGSGVLHVFNASNWSEPHTLTITGADDSLDDGDQAYQVVARLASFAPGYHGLQSNVALLNLDDDATATATLVVESLPQPSRSVEPVMVRIALSEPVPGGDGIDPVGTVTVRADTGESCTVPLPADSCVLPPLSTIGSRTLTARYDGDALHSPSEASSAHAVVRRADISIATLSVPRVLLPGMALDYVTVVSNAGPDDAPGTRVHDPVPAGLLGAQWQCLPLNGVCPAGSGAGDIDQLVDLASGATVVYTLSGTVATPEPATMTNAASITPQTGAPGHVLDPDSADQNASELDIGMSLHADGFEIVVDGRALPAIELDQTPSGSMTLPPYAPDAGAAKPLWLAWHRQDRIRARLDARSFQGRLFARLAAVGDDGLWQFGAWTAMPAAPWSARWQPAEADARMLQIEVTGGDQRLQLQTRR